MKKNNDLHCILFRLRKQGLNIDTKARTIYYEYNNPEQEAKMRTKAVKRLCSEFGYGRQAIIS